MVAVNSMAVDLRVVEIPEFREFLDAVADLTVAIKHDGLIYSHDVKVARVDAAIERIVLGSREG